MPVFRIHRMKEAPRENFRWAPHVSGMANVKPKDYEAAAEVDAESEYAAWALLRGSGQPLNVGDLLESPAGDLRICKYVGFEEARWILPEVRPEAQPGFVPPAAPPAQSAQV
jgi:hypothetical protein